MGSCSSRGGSTRRLSHNRILVCLVKGARHGVLLCRGGDAAGRLFTAGLCGVDMACQWILFGVCSLLATNWTAAAQGAPSVQNADSCGSLALPKDMNRESTIRIARALKSCDDLRKVFDRAQTEARALDFVVQESREEKAFQPGEIDNLLQQPQGQSQLLRQLAVEVAQPGRNAIPSPKSCKTG